MLGFRQRKHIKEVVFVDDFFRVPENGLPAFSENRKFLRAFFGAAALRANWRVREVCAQSQGGAIPVPEIMESLGLPQNLEGWARACTADLAPAAGHLGPLALSPASLVIGWGLPPSIMQYVDNQGAAFMDVEIHSIRFTRNLHLAVRTNDPAIRGELEQLRIDEESFWSAAAGLRGYFARRGQPFIVRPDLRVGLFVGQTAVDLALVGDGRLMRPVDFVPQITQWAQQVDLLVIRPHPDWVHATSLDVLLDNVPNAVLAGCNTYNLLCADNLAFVGGISSSVFREAPYLGCNDVRQLLVDDRNTASHLPATCSPWIPVRLDVASLRTLQAFAQARQNGKGCNLSRDFSSSDRRSTFPDEMLNDIFAYRWGFDLAASGLPELPELAPGQSVSLAAGAPGAVYVLFGYGWHSPENWGVWSTGGRASLIIPLAAACCCAGKQLELSLRGRLYVPVPVTHPTVRILVNGHECQTRAGQDGGVEWVIHFDADAVKHRMLVISVDVQGALRPCDASGSDDVRVLGYGLECITLRGSGESGPGTQPGVSR